MRLIRHLFIIWRRVFYWELIINHHTPLHPGVWVSYLSMTSRFPPFAFVESVSPYNKKNITRSLEDMNFTFSWQEQYLTRSLCSLVRYCSCHSNIKFKSSRHRVISSISLLCVWWARKYRCSRNSFRQARKITLQPYQTSYKANKNFFISIKNWHYWPETTLQSYLGEIINYMTPTVK